MKAVVAAFNQEKALVVAFSVIMNLRMDLFEALVKMLPKVVAGHVQRTLARPAVIGPPQPRVAVVALRARVARVPHRVVLTRAALLR